jgi:hypothetical protein
VVSGVKRPNGPQKERGTSAAAGGAYTNVVQLHRVRVVLGGGREGELRRGVVRCRGRVRGCI